MRSGYESFYEIFQRIIDGIYSEDNFNKNLLVESAGQLRNEFRTSRRLYSAMTLNIIDRDFLQWRNSVIRARYNDIITSMNAISIVCHIRDKCIMMGDVPKNILPLIKKDFSPKYIAVKAPHHGTKKYFSGDIPYGTYEIISNGGYATRKVCSEIVERAMEKIVCTRAHSAPKKYCIYAGENGCSEKCEKVGASYSISLK
jgi:hypothetical protein